MSGVGVVVFQSKRDLWLTIVITLTVIVMLVTAFSVLTRMRGISRLLLPFINIVGALFISWLMLATRYVVEERDLLVRSGPVRWRIPIASVTRIVETRDPIASPALSLERLRIEYGTGGHSRYVLVSPDDKGAFVRLLAEKNPAIKLE